MIRTIEWTDDGVVMIDQRLLPNEEVYNTYKTVEEVAEAIETMVIRGAPAIGVAAAMGIALGIKNLSTKDHLEEDFAKISARIERTRPTARNLFWAIERRELRRWPTTAVAHSHMRSSREAQQSMRAIKTP